MKSGVRKSGCPMPRLMMSRPCAASCVARASTANAFSSPMRSKTAIVFSMATSFLTPNSEYRVANRKGRTPFSLFAIRHSLFAIRLFAIRHSPCILPGHHSQDPHNMPSVAEKRATFRKLHEQGCFVIPNPWNVGSARYLQHLGFKALATTSSGFAHAQGYADGAAPRDMVLAHLREIAQATDVPLNADFEGGYADAPEGVAESVRLCVETGVAGLSIEDSTSDDSKPLYDFDLALARVRAARSAIDKAGGGVIFTARTEGFIRGRPDLDETIRRLKAFA